MSLGNESDFARHRQQAQAASDNASRVHASTWTGLQEAANAVLDYGLLDDVAMTWEFAWDGARSGGWVIGWPIDSRHFLTWNGCLLIRESMDGWLQFPSTPKAMTQHYVAIRPGKRNADWVGTAEPSMVRQSWGIHTSDPALARDQVRREFLARVQRIGGRAAGAPGRIPRPPSDQRIPVWGPLRTKADFFTNWAPRGVSWLLALVGAVSGVVGAFLFVPAITAGFDQGRASQSAVALVAAGIFGFLLVLLVAVILRSSLGRRPWLEKGTHRAFRLSMEFCARCEEPWGPKTNSCRRRGHVAERNKVTRYRMVSYKMPSGGWFLRRGPLNGPRLVGVAIPPGQSLGIPYLSTPPTRDDLEKGR